MSELAEVRIADRLIGPRHSPYVIAEISANHGHDLEVAFELVRVASMCGADAIKLQTYTPDTMTINSDAEPFRIGGGTLWDGRSLYDLYAEAMTPWEWHAPIRDEATRLGLHCISTPFDATAVAFLDELDLPALKISSFELTDHALIAAAAATGRPLIISTGMAEIDEIDAALAVARRSRDGGIVVLRCNSTYPAPVGQMDLRTIPDMALRWGLPLGLSDHTLGTTSSVVAVALGACVIEKHITLSRAHPGPDSAFSLEPDEFATLVREVRSAHAALGAVRYGPANSERPSLAFRRSIFAVADIAEGEMFTANNVRVIRPAGGLPPASLPVVVGATAATRISRGTPLRWELVGQPANASRSIVTT